ncbi:tetratricopeptide repeat protein [Paludisphaera soli]|uniref:tetratricopeptide repeat protein n=1 Tax=Paludisphaera soli TaxID=2712865 RepID=UPI0013EDDC3F|nr:tetratricopeptide repeat protein [Paludisphaera soli]
MAANSSKTPAPASRGRGPAPSTARRPIFRLRADNSWFLIWVAVAGGLSILLALVLPLVASRSADPDALWRDAQRSLSEQRIDDAERLLGRLTAARTPLPQDWMLRGQVEVARGRIDEAVAALEKVDDSHPVAAQARLLAGQVELRRDRARYAEQALLEALRLDPKLAQARRELIYIYGMQLRRRELCDQFAALSEVAALKFENLFHWFLMRNCQWEAGEVAQTLGRYLEADPDDRESRLALADNDRRLGLYDEAEEVLAPLPADDPRALAHRVMILMDRREEDQAEALLNEGPADDPELARLRGRVALARRDGPEALRWYRMAYEADPGNRDAAFGLINAYELCGEPEKAAPVRKAAEALEAFNSLVQRMATPAGRADPALVKQAVQVCTQAGLIPEARAWLKFAIGRDPLDAASQQALFRFNQQHPQSTRAADASPES